MNDKVVIDARTLLLRLIADFYATRVKLLWIHQNRFALGLVEPKQEKNERQQADYRNIGLYLNQLKSDGEFFCDWCGLCMPDDSYYDVDHIIPVALGGDMTSPDNLQVLCIDCHATKTRIDIAKIRGIEVLIQ